VRVRDTGGGIPEDVLPRIFDPFFTTKEDQNRTGLGLAVAHSIVEQHAGEISVRSTPGEGTEFTVALPVTAAATAGIKR
jgi:two-component system NtrC family sensor kinase